MARALLVVVGFCILLVSCNTQKVICPAYQSAYIYDKDALRKKFSYFNEDSTPKVLTASKTKYLIAEPTSYKKKVRSLQTVPMRPVNPVVPDSLKAGGELTKEELDLAAQSIIDSTYIVDADPIDSVQVVDDSVYVISKEREITILKYDNKERKYFVDTVGYNTEQNNYMWYLRDVLVLPDARLAQRQGSNEGSSATGGAKGEKKEKKGFFKNLFKKKDKSKVQQDSTQNIVPAEEEDYGYDDFEGKPRDSSTVQSPPQAQSTTPPKKGMFSFLKKKKTPKKKAEATPAKKEEVDDDGF